MNTWELRQLGQKMASGVPNRMYNNNAGDLAGIPGSPSRTPLAPSPFTPNGGKLLAEPIPDHYDLNYNDINSQEFYDQMMMASLAPDYNSTAQSGGPSFLAAAAASGMSDKKFRQMLAQQQQIWLREQMFKRDFLSGVQSPSPNTATSPSTNNNVNTAFTSPALNAFNSSTSHAQPYTTPYSPSNSPTLTAQQIPLKKERPIARAPSRNGRDSPGPSDSGNAPRSAFLEEFRSNKNKKYEIRDIVGSIVEFSSDQHGSRFIQQKLETVGNDEKTLVFDEILPAVVGLMTDVFGNYVVQKFFEYGKFNYNSRISISKANYR